MPLPFVTFSDLITEPERLELQEYALKLKGEEGLQPHPDGANRFFRSFWDGPLVTPLMRDVGRRLEQRFGLEGTPIDPELGWMIAIIYHGGAIQPHIDNREYQGKPFKHLRFNIVVSKPESGGVPVIGLQPLALVERGGWGFFASEVVHAATAVTGTKPRIVFRVGYCVPRTWTFAAEVASGPVLTNC